MRWFRRRRCNTVLTIEAVKAEAEATREVAASLREDLVELREEIADASEDVQAFSALLKEEPHA